MPRSRRRPAAIVAVTALAIAAASASPGSAAASPNREATLSPYFYIPGGNPAIDELPLEQTRVDIDVTGVIAEVEVVQTYTNRGTRPISARYVFPASTRAAVHGLEMTVGDHVIKAVAKERADARREFEKAEAEGKSASLLEQDRPNVFSMNVANIMPGDEIEVALSYTELIVPTDGIYELVFPTVVGPRYSEVPEAGALDRDRFAKAPYRGEGEPPDAEFSLRAAISAPIPVARVSSPSHGITSYRRGRGAVRVELDPAERAGGDRDFILRYQLAGQQISSGLMLHEGERENVFMLMVEPPERVDPEAVPPREYVFVVDNSGSMTGFPLDTAKVLVGELARHLRPVDSFNLILFDGEADVMAPRSVPATAPNLRRAREMLGRATGGGGTRLRHALSQAMALPHAPGSSRSFVVVTDGYILAEAEVFDEVRRNLGDANVFAFGIGSSINRHLVEGLARAGMGEPFIVTDPSDARATAERFIEYVRAPALTDIRIELEDFGAYDISPAHVPDLLADRPVVIHGKWMGKAEGAITLRGMTGHGELAERFEVASASRASGRGLTYLWARNRIAELSDFASAADKRAVAREITDLGLAYNLLTEHTSFVAVYDRVRNRSGDAQKVDQPLPLPAGVTEAAIGSGVVGAPEPELGVLLALVPALAAASLARRRRAGKRSVR